MGADFWSFISTSVIFSLVLIMVEPTDKPARRAHFDEQELTEYDLTRGQKMVIDDPKTPWEDDEQSADIEMTNE
jgi:hypothetical protein